MRAAGLWVILIKGLTPIPYKIVTIASGAAQFNFWIFMAASLVTRGTRFFLVAALLRLLRRPGARLHRAAADSGHQRCGGRALSAASCC